MQLKFKAWDSLRNEYLSAGEVYINRKGKIFLDILKFEIKDNRFIIELFTGVKDKNKKDIYADDLILYINKIYKIIWHDDNCCWEYSELKWNKNQHSWSFNCDIACECEVVGNIHENPELLKENEKPKLKCPNCDANMVTTPLSYVSFYVDGYDDNGRGSSSAYDINGLKCAKCELEYAGGRYIKFKGFTTNFWDEKNTLKQWIDDINEGKGKNRIKYF